MFPAIIMRRRTASRGSPQVGHRGISGRGIHGNTAASAGFTLMEVMIAILILGIVVVTVLASFNTVFSTTGALEETSNFYQLAQNCLNRMRIDLQSVHVLQRPLYQPPGIGDAGDPYRIEGSESDIDGTGFAKLRFVTRAHLAIGDNAREGLAEVVYYADVAADGSAVLKRADNLFPFPAFEERVTDPILCEHVKSLQIKYLDEQGEEYEYWNSDSEERGYASPTAVAIKLELGEENRSFFFGTVIKLPRVRKKME